MKISINDNKRIEDLQQEFQSKYPYLKLEFFKKPHAEGISSPKKSMLAGKLLSECRKIHNSGNIIITPGMKVAELEQEFLNIYGLSVQVFRKSGREWLETSVTDGWTLAQQNIMGKESAEWEKPADNTEMEDLPE